MKPIFIFNPNASNGKLKNKFNKILNTIRMYFPEFDYIITNNENDIDNYLNYIDKHDSIIAIGGDGTINAVVNHTINLLDKPYGIISLGTGNDLIYSLGISSNLHQALQTIKKNKTIHIDVGKIKTDKFEKYFLNAAGIGYDAMVAKISNDIKFTNGKLKYYVSLLYSLFNYQYNLINIKIDEKFNKLLNPFLVTIGNGKRTGGAFILTPDAKIDDSFFQICLIDKVNIPLIIKSLPSVFKGNHYKVKQVMFVEGKKINICSNKELYIHYDGETPSKANNVDVTIIHKKIKFLIP